MDTILIIEDNIQLQKYLCDYLQTYGFDPHVLTDYSDVNKAVTALNPRLVLLDINLPMFDGFYFLRQIRKNSPVPVIILSARSDEAEQIRGIEGGAYDYITKPFSIGVLMAKINALLNRTRGEDGEIHINGLTLSRSFMTLSYGSQSLSLSKNEYKILALFLSRAGHYFSREAILEVLWDDTAFVDDNTLTVNISRVKKKLAALGLPNAVQTKRGVGYAFDAINPLDHS